MQNQEDSHGQLSWMFFQIQAGKFYNNVEHKGIGSTKKKVTKKREECSMSYKTVGPIIDVLQKIIAYINSSCANYIPFSNVTCKRDYKMATNHPSLIMPSFFFSFSMLLQSLLNSFSL